METILGLFSNYAAAERAVGLWLEQEYDTQALSVIAQKRVVVAETDRLARRDGPDGRYAARTGTIRRAALGELTGLLVGLGATAVPGLGAVVARGPLATAVVTATDGLERALMRVGLAKAVAQAYRDGLCRGGIVLAIHHVDRFPENAARQALQCAGASRLVHVHLDTVAMEKMQQWYLTAQRTAAQHAVTN